MTKKTARLILRSPLPSDLERVFAIHGDPATNRFNPAGPLTHRVEASAMLDRWLGQWSRLGFGPWAITPRDAPDHILGFGGLSLHDYLGVERVNLGYRFDVVAWGNGYATELAHAALDHGFDELAMAEVFALVRPDHRASIRVLEKVGMA